jgi:hypothetical protein
MGWSETAVAWKEDSPIRIHCQPLTPTLSPNSDPDKNPHISGGERGTTVSHLSCAREMCSAALYSFREYLGSPSVFASSGAVFSARSTRASQSIATDAGTMARWFATRRGSPSLG